MNNPLVSVVITTYNRAELVSRAINGVLAQSYINIEIIVVDDCSTDNTESIVNNNYQNKVKYIKHKENQGVQFASNTGYKYAKGKYVAFIGDDDQWSDKDKVRVQVDIFERDIGKQYGIVTTDVKVIEKNKSYKKNIKRPKNLIKHILDRNGVIYGSAALIRSDVFKMAGQFKEELPKGTDSDVFRRIIFFGYDVFFIEKDMVDYYFDLGDNMTILNERGLNRSIIAQQYKLNNYKVLMDYYPDVKSRALYLIACYYYQQWCNNNNKHALKLSSIHFRKSIRAYPFNVRSILKLLRNYIKKGVRHA
jgi:glycosyltransferase involved in cell wall biosynthesis